MSEPTLEPDVRHRSGAAFPGTENEPALRILILEDLATDAELIEFELKGAGLRFDTRLASTREDFQDGLTDWSPHIVLADYSLPGFDGMEALRIARARAPDVPFLFVSGALGEERAIETLKQGATDYVLKDKLSRLPSAVERALEEAEERRARREAEEALRRSERTQRTLLEITTAAASKLDRSALFEAFVDSLGHAMEFDRATLGLREADDDELLRVFTLEGGDAGGASLDRSRAHRLEQSAFGEVIRRREPRIRDDLAQTDPEYEHEAEARARGIRSYIMVPLLVKDRVVGALAIGSETPGRYGEEEVGLLLQVGRQLSLAVDNMLAYEEVQQLRRQLELENVYLREELQEAGAFGGIVGTSTAIREVEEQIEQVAPTEAAVLVLGESGTGKELVAREIHDRSERSDGPLIKVNCAAIPRELYESEFFGHAKGAFSGAVRDRTGRFAAADGGTLFLDEVGEIPPDLQGKLLRVLQDGTFQRVGEERTRTANVRIIAATNRDLAEEVRAGRFREDLYYRINVFPIEVPPLRQRPEDIPILASHFLEQATRTLRRDEELRLTEANVAELRAYEWPGNVRELQNAVERAVITARQGRLRFDLPDSHRQTPRSGSRPLPGEEEAEPEIIPEAEMQRRMKENIRAALEKADGKIYGEGGAAELLGIPPTTLASRIKSLGLER